MDFGEAYDRLQEIVTEIRDKDLTLDRSLELLEEGVRLANICTEKIDYTAIAETQGADASAEEVSGEIVASQTNIPEASPASSRHDD